VAVAVGVAAGITIGIVTYSLRETAVQILQVGRADFSITQRGVTDVLNSVMDEGDLAAIGADPDVLSTVGVLVALDDLGSDNPMFLEIGVPPTALEEFGVRIVAGRAYTAEADDEVMLGFRAARNLDKQVGDTLQLGDDEYTVVGLYATDQEFGDSASMLPLVHLQAGERKPGDVTIAFVRVRPGTDVDALRQRIEHDHPQLVTVRTASEFGRADRNLQLLSAADDGATVLAFCREGFVAGSEMGLDFTPTRAHAKPPGEEIAFEVEDVPAAHARALAAGGMEVMAPREKPWGQVVSYLRDPNGALVELCTAIPA
jgi:putative ABC transport system permease protein